MQRNLNTLDETASFAKGIAGCIESGDVILLVGDLGAGKTTFAKALIHALSETEEDVPSPTFTLVQTYETKKGPLWHVDLYRLEDPEEVYELGWEEAAGDAIILVEWPDRLPAGLLPENRLELALSFTEDENSRVATLTPHGSWTERADELIK